MKYTELLIDQLKPLPHFAKGDIYQIGKQWGIGKSTVDTCISRFLGHRKIFQLKNGMYVTADFLEKSKTDTSYIFYLANAIRSPSYVSFWTALQYYDLATERIAGVVSTTVKVTRNYENRAGSFAYHSIKEDLFSGFVLVKSKFDFFIASPSKALFDLLYFRTRQFRGVRPAMIDELINELRVNIEEMDKNEQTAFHAMIKKHFNG